MFTNKHVVVAMLVAPVLAILAWFAVDSLVAEKPHAAQAGASYALAARSNCRYDSGQCDLVNGDFKVTLRPTAVSDSEVGLELLSKHSLQRATIGLASGQIEEASSMTATDDRATRWVVSITRPDRDEATIRVAVVAAGSTYYAEVPVVFLDLQS